MRKTNSRKGLGRGKGKGYKNLIKVDPLIHSRAGKHQKTYSSVTENRMKRDPNVWRLQYKELDSKNVKNNRNKHIAQNFDHDKFEKMNKFKKRGFIIDLAKKSAKGVKYAIEWEKEHLPKQEQWVKDEFHKAKENFQDFVKEFKRDPDAEKSPEQVDAEEVKDELDHDDDGHPDIKDEDLDRKNDEIKEELDTIDKDGNAVPDYMEDQPYESKEGEAIITYHIDDAIKELDKEDADKIKAQRKVEKAKKVAEKSFGTKAGELVNQIGDILTRKQEIQEQTKRLIEEVGSEREKMELRKKPDEIDVQFLSDATLREMAIRYKEPALQIFGSPNPFKDELLERMKKREQLKEAERKLDMELDFKREQLEEELKKKRLEFRKGLK